MPIEKTIAQASHQILKLPPKTAVFAKIRMEEIQMEVSKAVDAKARWEDMDRVRREESQQRGGGLAAARHLLKNELSGGGRCVVDLRSNNH